MSPAPGGFVFCLRAMFGLDTVGLGCALYTLFIKGGATTFDPIGGFRAMQLLGRGMVSVY